jgi:hypothetical protein
MRWQTDQPNPALEPIGGKGHPPLGQLTVQGFWTPEPLNPEPLTISYLVGDCIRALASLELLSFFTHFSF